MSDGLKYEVEEIKWQSLVERIQRGANTSSSGPVHYRGQANADWPLETVLERACKNLGVCCIRRAKVEDELIREFKRRAHQYTQDLPPQTHTLEWLSLMRHSGAPTRLLDFSYSFFVAAFFAMKSESPHNSAAIWELHWDEDIDGNAYQQIVNEADSNLRYGRKPWGRNRDMAAFDRYYRRPNPISFIRPTNPIELTERLTIQQGVFLCPGNVTKSFESNLFSHQLKLAQLGLRPLKLTKYVIPSKERIFALSQLQRMNIDEATLFPGLDGFARSLGTKVHLYHPPDWR